MRQQLSAATTLIASTAPAFADPGHLEEAAGHAHWLAFGALSLAGLVALTGLVLTLRRRRPETTARTAGQN